MLHEMTIWHRSDGRPKTWCKHGISWLKTSTRSLAGRRNTMIWCAVSIKARALPASNEGTPRVTKAWDEMPHVERQKHCAWSMLCTTNQDAVVGGHVLAPWIYDHGITTAQRVDFYP